MQLFWGLRIIIENFKGEGEIIEEARGKLLNVQELEQMNSRLKADSDTLELDVIDHDGNK